MVLHPLEFSECFLDSPWFRQSIREYEDELERTNTQIKQLIKDAKTMLQASRKQGETMQLFSDRLQKFRFEIIGENLTDDERGIAGSLKEFGMMLQEIEGEWTRTIERAELQLIQPLENFRKEHIHSYREAKKAFDKSSERYYKQMEQTLGLSHKKKENQLLDADNDLIIQKRNFHESSLNYVFKLQEVQERKKFEFVEHLLMFMQVYFNFFHQTHETAIDCKEYMNEIQLRLVSTRSQYEGTRSKTQDLMRKMMADPSSHSTINQSEKNSSPNRVAGQRWARAGYLQLLDKSAIGHRFASKWPRYFCMYTKENKLFQMMAPAGSSSSGNPNKISSNHGSSGIVIDPLIVLSCVRKSSDSIDKRFCFDIDVEDSAGKQATLTLQALSNPDRKKWIAVMDGKEPNYVTTGDYKKTDQFSLNPTSLKFVEDVINEIERRGLDAEGIYRLVGVSSKVDKLLQIVMDPKTTASLNYQDDSEWELNTLTSALKNFFRNLPEPIMTFEMHEEFIKAAKRENPEERLNRVMNLVGKLTDSSKQVLKSLIHHLVKVSEHSDVNKMTVQNIGVCFGPTLMRPKQETVQSIMEIKFNNIIVEILIENYAAIFGQEGLPPKAEKAFPALKTSMDRLPSQRFKTRPKGIHEKFGIDAITEENTPLRKTSSTGLHPTSERDQSPRFIRAHAIRGPPGRPLSPRSQMKMVKAEPVDEDASSSSSDTNTDEFGRMSPLDLDFGLDHHFGPQNPTDSGNTYFNLLPKTQPVDPPAAERVNKESWRISSSRRSLRKSNSSSSDRPKTSQSEKKHELHRKSDASRHSYSAVQKSDNTNKNNNKRENVSAANDSKTPSVWQRKEKLLDSMRKSNAAGHALTQKGSVIRRRKTPLQGEKPEMKPTSNSQSVDIEKLKGVFSSQDDPKSIFSPQPQGNGSGDHDTSFLWPKPGSLKANTYVEGNLPKETRPRSTVLSSRVEIAKSPSEDSKIPEVPITPSGDVKPTRKRIFETLYACEAEHDSELSFRPGQLITDVTESEEPGWLVGTLDGQKGLVPANYVREKLWD